MRETTLPSGGSFQRRLLRIEAVFSVLAIGTAVGSALVLLDLPAEQWRFLGLAALVTGTVATVAGFRLQVRAIDPLTRYLDRRAADEVPAEPPRRAFAALLDLPRRMALIGGLGSLLSALVMALSMRLRFGEQWGAYEFAVVALVGTAAALVVGPLLLFQVKRSTEALRSAFCLELPDPEERGALIRPLRLRSKLLVCITGVTLVPVIFSGLLSARQGHRDVEEFTVAWQHRALDGVAMRLEVGDSTDPSAPAPLDPAQSPAPLRLTILDPQRPLAESILDPRVRPLLERGLAEGSRRGDSLGEPSTQLFSWLRLSDGRVLVGLTPKSAIHRQPWMQLASFAPLLLVSAAVALCLAWLISSEVGAATEALERDARRMASGDLTPGPRFESEDELGELSRSFAGMADGLRAAVAGAARALGQVEETAGELASVADQVGSVTHEQVGGIRQASASMDEINRRVKGIADSSQVLSHSVEESSSSILELGAAGNELEHTASVLSGRVDEVATSIEQMVSSVRRVSESTEGLVEASVETSASMEEMAASMRAVDSAAEETARLSGEVVVRAEGGQQKVSQTIEGMDAIREATETAERVMRNLGERTTEIGAIVDVIDDVADETNLLALNAAIIAAQAGEHGRAFSVVAEEIKDLADRVLASTKEIGTLIRGVQEETSNAIGAVERGTASVASGVELSAEAGVALEDITRASRDSGKRIAAIVAAVREQAKAASHVVSLMEGVRAGVNEIRAASKEQARGNYLVHESSVAMRRVTLQVRGTTEEQARGAARLGDSIEGIRDAVGEISEALQQQSAACRSTAEFLEAVQQRTRSHEESAARMDAAARGILGQAHALRQALQRFRI